MLKKYLFSYFSYPTKTSTAIIFRGCKPKTFSKYKKKCSESFEQVVENNWAGRKHRSAAISCAKERGAINGFKIQWNRDTWTPPGTDFKETDRISPYFWRNCWQLLRKNNYSSRLWVAFIKHWPCKENPSRILVTKNELSTVVQTSIFTLACSKRKKIVFES